MICHKEPIMDAHDFFIRNRLNPKRIFSGFSGGADSTALLLLLNEYCTAMRIELIAVHFEHGLRGKDGRADAAWCRRFCEIRKIPFLVISLDVPKNKKKSEGTEEAARRLRLVQWRKIADCKGDFIALGHNADDRIENLFIRMLRGANASGLTSLRELAKFANLNLIRPILPFHRTEIEKFLKGEKVRDWRNDSTNSQDIFRRNFIRNSILPKMRKKIPGSDKAILRSLNALSLDAECLEKIALENYGKIKKNKRFLSASEAIMTHPAILIRLLRLWISDHLKSDFIPDGYFLDRVILESAKFADEKHGINKKSVRIPVRNGTSLTVTAEKLFLSEIREGKKTTSCVWKWKKDSEAEWGAYRLKACFTSKKSVDLKKLKDGRTVYFDADKLPEELLIRSCNNGDKMLPFGSKTGEIKLKKIFESAKISADEKRQVPLLCLPDGTIIWVAGVRRAKFADVTSGTAKFAKFQVI